TTYKITVIGYIGSGGSASTLVDADGDTKIQVEESADEDKLRFDTAGNERMVIDNAGKVGIGTGTPTQELDIHGSDAATASILLTNFGTSNSISPLFTMQRTNGTRSAPTAVVSGNRLGALNW